jgi:hypothetical protein
MSGAIAAMAVAPPTPHNQAQEDSPVQLRSTTSQEYRAMKLPMGKRELDVGGAYLDTQLRDSRPLLGDVAALHQRLDEDGYLLIRGLHPRQRVLDARRAIVEHLTSAGALAPGGDAMDASIQPGAQPPGMMGRKGIVTHPAVRAVLEGQPVFDFFTALLGGEVLTYSYKWLRAVGAGGNTGAHYDVVYMGRGTVDKLYTVWTPMGDVPLELGTLAIIPGSHRLPGFARLRATYGKMDVDRDHVVGGWISEDPIEVVEKFGGRWQTTPFEAGDVIIFGMFTMHASTNNTTSRYRISCDTRFQLAGEPVDERWVGENPKGHYNWTAQPEKMVSVETARKQWGV